MIITWIKESKILFYVISRYDNENNLTKLTKTKYTTKCYL